LLIATTGVLMFFHLDSGLNKLAHEWLGWFLLVGVGAHLVLNWRAFSTYFKRPVALSIMGAGVALLAASFVPVGGASGEVPVRDVLSKLAEAPIATVAAVAGKDPAAVLAALGASYPDAKDTDTLASLAGGDTEAGVHLLSQVFAAGAAE
jgi:hypothetical protein